MQLVKPEGEFQAEGVGLRVDPVRTANHDRVLVLERLRLQRVEQFSYSSEQQKGRFLDLQRLRSIDDIVRRQPIVEPARVLFNTCIGHGFGNASGERDHIVTRFPFDLGDPGRICSGMLSQFASRFGRNIA